MTSLTLGQLAPDFTRTAQDGQSVTLSAYRGQSPVVVFFYPKDSSPICTREACSFRDRHEDFQQAGAVVIGVSGDSEASHQRFAAEQRLPFLLLSDADGSLRQLWGVPKSLGILPGRVTYVLDRQGIVRRIINAPWSAQQHSEEALQALQELA